MRRITAIAAFAAALAVSGPASASSSSSDGRIVFQSNRHGGVAELYTMNPDATDVRRLTWNAVADRLPRFSPDGRRIVFARTVEGIDQDIWIMNADGSGERRLTSGPERDDAPVFARDGEHVVFQRVADPLNCPCELRLVGADGTGERPLVTGPGNALHPDVSRTGRLAFASDRDGTLSIYVGDLRGGRAKRITEGPAAFGDFRPRWSPRGNELVFMRDDGTNLNDIYVVGASGKGLRRLTSGPRFEEQAQWSPDGERIVFGVFDLGAPGARLHTIDSADGGGERQLPRLAVPYLETYDDGRRDEAFWHEIRDPGSSIGEVGGRLVISIAGTAVPGGPLDQIAAHWGSNCRLAGDFDYQVDYELLAWPRNSGYFAALNGFFGDAGVARHSNPWDPPFDEQYSGWRGGPDFANGVLNTTDRAGSLRLVRTGQSIATYVRSPGGAWTLVFGGGGVGGETVMGTGLSVPAWSFAGKDGSVAFDDFRLNSGELTCPSWWRDAAPDWAAEPRRDGKDSDGLSWDPVADFERYPGHANPSGAWSYLWSDGPAHDPSRYHPLPHYTVVDVNREQWDDPASLNLLVGHLGGEGRLLFHSYGGTAFGFGRNAILAWTSPVSGRVSISGDVRLPPLSQCGVGSGIVWSIDRGGSTLRSVLVAAGGAADFDASTAVKKGETLYFVHDAGFDSNCDSASVALEIVAG